MSSFVGRSKIAHIDNKTERNSAEPGDERVCHSCIAAGKEQTLVIFFDIAIYVSHDHYMESYI